MNGYLNIPNIQKVHFMHLRKSTRILCSLSQKGAVGILQRRGYDSDSLQTIKNLNKYSRTITEPPSQGASQAMLYATGLTSKTITLPQIGICSIWLEGNPCNMHLLDLSGHVKEGVEKAGLVGFRFNTIGVSDGISMGTDGMSYSLQSRDIIADSIETTMAAQW